MIEKIHFAQNDGYFTMDEEKNQGMFAYYYPPSRKVVLNEIWRNKNGDLRLAYNKRKNLNVNILPSIAKDVIEMIGILAGIQKPSPSIPTEDAPPASVETLEKTIRDIGGV